jgi:hypothetical protein
MWGKISMKYLYRSLRKTNFTVSQTTTKYLSELNSINIKEEINEVESTILLGTDIDKRLIVEKLVEKSATASRVM